MELIFDLTKKVGRQWREQSTHKTYVSENHIENSTIQYNKVIPSIVNVLNYPKSYPLRRQNLEQIKKFNRLINLIENKKDVDLKFINPETIPFNFDQLKDFKSIEFNTDINTSFASVKQLMEVENMTLKFSGDDNLELLKFIITLKNKNYPAKVIL